MTFNELMKEADIDGNTLYKIWYSDVKKSNFRPLKGEKWVYMLICNEEIVYIGSSTNVVNRLLDHKYRLNFDYLYMGGIDQQKTVRDMLFMESFLIGIADPVLNFTDYTSKNFKCKSIDYIKQHIKTAYK